MEYAVSYFQERNPVFSDRPCTKGTHGLRNQSPCPDVSDPDANYWDASIIQKETALINFTTAITGDLGVRT